MNKNKAFTLFELMIATAIFSIISLALIMALNYTRSSIEIAHVNAELQEELQRSLSAMSAELRQTNQSKITAGPILNDDIWYDSISFAVPFDIDGDGDIIGASGLIEWSDENPANWAVSYALSNNQVIRSAGDGRAPILANNITSLVFKRSSLTPLLIDISLIASKNTLFNRTVTIALSHKVKMRN